MQVQGNEEPIHQRKSWGPRHAVSNASLPRHLQPGRPITGAASHTDGQPRLQLSGARLTSLKKEDARRLARSLLGIAGGHGRRAGWLHLGAHHAAFREKLPERQATGRTCTMAVDARSTPVGQVPVVLHPLRFSSSLCTCAFSRLTLSLPHRLTVGGGVDGNLSIRRCRMDWCDPPPGGHLHDRDRCCTRGKRADLTFGGSTSPVRWDEGSRGRISRLI